MSLILWQRNVSTMFLLISLLTISFINGCKRSIDPVNNERIPVADAGADQTTIAGGYAILDGSGSYPASGENILWYEWTADDNNPDEVFLSSGHSDSIQLVGFTTEGLYKFSLVVISSDKQLMTLDEIMAANKSEPVEVEIMVNPRSNILFQDPSLEVHARYVLKKPSELLTETDIASLDSLASYNIMVDDVKSLHGIEHCTNLSYIGMSHQRISDLSPLANLTKLTKLEFSQNHTINDVSPLANLVQLQYLNLRSNQIIDISRLENLIQLTYLNLNYNHVSDISVLANMKELEELWLSDLTNIDLSPLTDLKKLSLLWMPACQINDINPIKNLINLKKIYFDNNQINDISPLIKLTQLERLYLADNQIVDISALENLVNLTNLRLWNNQITDILPLVNNTGLGEGDYVGLIDNPLSEISINEYIPTLIARGVIVHWP